MKKTLSIILASVIIISSLVALAVPAAAETEGNWDVMLTASSVDADSYKNPPLPGYYYDEAGLHTVSPNYRDHNPRFSVVSKEMYNIRDFSMTIVVHDYRTYGDNWISFTVWSDSNGFAQGDTSGKYGDGWTSIIRAGADGIVNRFESWDQTKGIRTGKQVFKNIDNTQVKPIVFEPIVDAKTGDFTITFAIENGVVKVNGMEIGEETDSCISKRFEDGLAYVGVTLHNTDSSGGYYPTISITDVNGEVPCGSDSRKAEDPGRFPPQPPYYPPVDENQPAIWFDATLERTNYKLPTSSGCQVGYSDDNCSFLITQESSVNFIHFVVPDAITYEASEYNTIAIIFKNFCTCGLKDGLNPNKHCRNDESMSLWYCAGQQTSYEDNLIDILAVENVTPTDENGEPIGNDYYSVAIITLPDEEWNGRIHSLRLDILGYNYNNQFEIMGIGAFRSTKEAAAFIYDFRDLGLGSKYYEPPVECYCVDSDNDGICDYCMKEMVVPNETTTVEDVTVTETEDTQYTEEIDTQNAQTEETEYSSNYEVDSIKPIEDSLGVLNIGFSGCQMSTSLGIVSIVSIIGAAVAIKKKED